MVNDTTTLNGALTELGETMATNISAKGVTASASDGLTTLAGKISQIQTGGGGASNVVQGTFTTGTTRNTTGTVTLSYNGNGYPIAYIVCIEKGMYNNTSGGNQTWYNLISQYDIGFCSGTKASMNTPPTYRYGTSAQNYGSHSYLYKSSTSSPTDYTSKGNVLTMYDEIYGASYQKPIVFASSSSFQYYIGNNTNTTIGLTTDTKYEYTVIYSE